MKYKTIAERDTTIRLSCIFAANCRASRVEFVLDDGACQKTDRKVRDTTPIVMAMEGMWIRHRPSAYILLFLTAILGFSPVTEVVGVEDLPTGVAVIILSCLVD